MLLECDKVVEQVSYDCFDIYRDMFCYLMISSVPGLDIHICSPQQY